MFKIIAWLGHYYCKFQYIDFSLSIIFLHVILSSSTICDVILIHTPMEILCATLPALVIPTYGINVNNFQLEFDDVQFW